MKRNYFFILSFLAFIAFAACQKENENTVLELETTKATAIQKGEPIVFTLSQAASGSTVNWSVSPSANTQINVNGNKASVLFANQGNYTVSANAANINASKQVSVMDSVYKAPGSGSGSTGTPAVTLPFSSGELIKITVSRIDSGARSGLVFSAQTTNSYTCLTNYLISSYTKGTNSHTINYTGVFVPSNCTIGTAKAGAFSYLSPVSSGSNTLTINVNGTTYSGTIVKTGNSYVINWIYTSGVTISPTNL
jgi:hypothetical protein